MQQIIAIFLALTCTFVAASLSILWLVRWIKTKSRILLLFCISFSFFTLWAVGNGLVAFSTNELLVTFVLLIANYVGFVAILLFFPIVELFEHENLTVFKSLVFAFMLGAVTLGLFVPNLYWLDKSVITGAWIFHSHQVIDFIRLLAAILITFYFLWVMRKMIKVAPKKLKKQIYILSIGFVIGIDGVFFIYVLNFVNILPDIELRFVVASIGLVIMGYLYLRNPSLSLILTQRVHHVLVIHNSGLTLYNHEFHKGGLGEDLIGGAIDAISKFLQEALGIRTNLKEIKLFDRDILLDINEYFACVLITDKSTYFLKESLKKFNGMFLEKYKKQLEKFTGETSLYEGAETLLKDCFSYLPEFS